MSNNSQSRKTTQNPSSKGNVEPVVTDFGTRKISNQNFSKMIAIPKTALANCCPDEVTEVNVQLVQQNGEKFLKLSPICKINQKEVKQNK